MKFLVCFFLSISVASCTLFEQSRETALKQVLEHYPLNGFVHLEQGGTVYLHQQLGLKGESLHIPSDTDRFYLASLTKLFVEITSLALVDEGVLHLDSSIGYYRPSLRGKFEQKLKIKHLLDMQSGLPREWEGVRLKPDALGFYGPALDSLPATALQFEPGSKTAYSNLNYWLLGAVIESVTQRNLDEVLETYLFEPVGMQHSGLLPSHSNDPMHGYKKEGGVWVTDTTDYSMRYASGGAYSTAKDMLALGRALGKEGLLSTEAYQNLLSASGMIEAYGSLPSYTNMFIVDPKTDLILLVVNNVGLEDPDQMIALKKELLQALDMQWEESGANKKVTLQPMHTLQDSIPLERGMKEWVAAIEKGDADKIFEVFDAYATPNSNSRDDATWEEIVRLRKTLPNFRPAGFRWLKNGIPGGLEVWFVCDEDAKIAFMWIPDEVDSNKAAALFIKPDDVKWLGDAY